MGKGRGGDALVPSRWACLVLTLHIQAAGPPRTAGVSSRLWWQGHGLFLEILTLAKTSPPRSLLKASLGSHHPPSARPPHPDPTDIPWSPAWLRSRVTRGHSAFFFPQAFNINIHNTRHALGAGWQHSLTGAEIFFLAGLWGVGVTTKAVPVFQGDATGAGGSGTTSVCCAHRMWDPLLLLLEVVQEKGPVLAPQGFLSSANCSKLPASWSFK